VTKATKAKSSKDAAMIHKIIKWTSRGGGGWLYTVFLKQKKNNSPNFPNFELVLNKSFFLLSIQPNGPQQSIVLFDFSFVPKRVAHHGEKNREATGNDEQRGTDRQASADEESVKAQSGQFSARPCEVNGPEHSLTLLSRDKDRCSEPLAIFEPSIVLKRSVIVHRRVSAMNVNVV